MCAYFAGGESEASSSGPADVPFAQPWCVYQTVPSGPAPSVRLPPPDQAPNGGVHSAGSAYARNPSSAVHRSVPFIEVHHAAPSDATTTSGTHQIVVRSCSFGMT